MGNEIKVQSEVVREALAELKSSVQALETNFAKTIDGNNKLEIVDQMNNIKQRYDELLTKYEALLLQNIEETDKAVGTYEETDQSVASGISLVERK